VTAQRKMPFRREVLSYYSAAHEVDRPLCKPRWPLSALLVGLALMARLAAAGTRCAGERPVRTGKAQCGRERPSANENRRVGAGPSAFRKLEP
jgi:hypothetical protein